MGDIDVELDSLDRAVDLMTSGVVDDLTSLSRDFTDFLQDLDRNAWSTEDACADFARSYVAAIEAYDQVLQGVRSDVTRYRDALEATVREYRGRDDSVMHAMNNQLARLDDTLAGDRMGEIAYQQRSGALDDGSGAASNRTGG